MNAEQLAELRRIVGGPGMHLGLMQEWFPALLDYIDELKREISRAHQAVGANVSLTDCELGEDDARLYRRIEWLKHGMEAERDSAIAAMADANEQLAAARADAERWRACKVHGFPRPVYNPEYRINYWRVLNDDTFPVSPEAAIDAAITAGKERGDA